MWAMQGRLEADREWWPAGSGKQGQYGRASPVPVAQLGGPLLP